MPCDDSALNDAAMDASPTAHSRAVTSAPSPAPEISRALRAMHLAMHALFVVLLAVGLVRGIIDAGGSPARITVVVAATAAFGALYALGLRLRQRSEAWVVGLVLAWVALLFVVPDVAWVAFALYFLVLHSARRALAAALVGVVFVASVLALNLGGQSRGPGAVLGPFMGMLVALGIAWVYVQLRRENDHRRALVDQLVAAQDDVLAGQEELAAAQHEAGVLAERERLARDIHDTLAQSFSSILLLSRAGLARTPDDALLRQIEQTAAVGLTQARDVVHALAPAELADAPLFDALVRLGDRLAEQTGITVRTDLDGDVRPLPAALDVALLRIAQSALANVRLHSGADRAGITLSYEPDAVRLEVIDDGVGFTDDDVARAPLSGSGFGLRAIRERVEALAGDLTVESHPGEGAALLVTLPTVTQATGGAR